MTAGSQARNGSSNSGPSLRCWRCRPELMRSCLIARTFCLIRSATTSTPRNECSKAPCLLVISLSSRQLMPRVWALAATLASFLWLRPNGPFKSVPMHYGALLLALAMYFLLKHENSQKRFLVFLAGASLGLVALFKHNIGAYALVGSIVFLLFEGRGDAPQTSAMSDKLQFVAGKPKEPLKRLSDKLKFVGHLD